MTREELRVLAEGVRSMVERLVQPALNQLCERIDAANARIDGIETCGARWLGVWQGSVDYKRGSFVSHDGALWHANDASTGERPGTGKAWQLAVKSGGAR